jgi:hypothetical protein
MKRKPPILTPEIRYELWKNDVIQRARELYQTAQGVGHTGILAIDLYNAAHHRLWEVFEREPKA